MATTTQSPSPNSNDDKPQAVQQDISPDATKQSVPASVFVNSEPIREDQDPTPSSQPPSSNPDGQAKSSSIIQTQASIQAPQPMAAVPAGIASSGTVAQKQFQWYHAVSAVGLLAASGCGRALLFKVLISSTASLPRTKCIFYHFVFVIIPKLKLWIRKVVLEEENDHTNKIYAKPSLAEEATAAAKAAAAAAADIAKASQEMLNSKNEERSRFEEFMNLMDVQMQEMKPMSNSIRKLEGQAKVCGKENDMPPNRNQLLSNPRIAPRSKVLQSQTSAEGLNQNGQGNGLNYLVDDESLMPWWQRKNGRITEIENEDKAKAAGPYGVRTNEQPPIKRS
ncbi:Peroxin 14, putative isoform 4 [Hibiscus syriacus]|uniref:Peroxisomal membrane protein PEX14 n=1 Tax=Hibiscus syriacus TaxID=106335 RepID=A0A6A3CFN9_HIBSY|nr:Peroxin 14, putative isoform 4 [Hibiscus syriacus]